MMFGITTAARGHGGPSAPFQELEHIANSLFGRTGQPGFELDVRDLGRAFQVEADLPGVSRGDLRVELEGNYLTISGQRRSQTETNEDSGRFVRRERTFGSFRRCFDVSHVDTEGITAVYADGVLTLTLPKKEPEQGAVRRLEIQQA